ncbi:MAG: DNA replication/repair protein RecF [Bacteroidales bacterium]|nr:DNA replication/repair protein RecF [Bacteroidales bacterium]MCF8338442.1 DNA replication/repair protein RecF [Bacteroidales bacterium]
MYLRRLKLSNFKNHPEAGLDFSPKINCFIGDNGVGKTNILDAIYYLSFCKSYFNPIDSQNIMHEAEFFAIHGDYDKNGETTDTVTCQLKRNQKKKFKRNQKEYDRLAEHIGLYPLVMVSPYDRDLINDGSELRRRYIDSVISQFDRTYLNNLMNYNKALSQRNYLLKKFAENHSFDKATLEIWDEQMIKLGAAIYEERRKFLEAFTPIFQQYFEFISGGHETVSITYASQLHDYPMRQLMDMSLEKDRAVRYSTAGIHKDDLLFQIDGHPIKKFGSQGQQKSFVIAIKLAQFDYTKELKSFKPILLFDDIFDKLDENRVAQLIKLVSENNFGQVFITDTQRERIENVFEQVDIDHKIFSIFNGTIREE